MSKRPSSCSRSHEQNWLFTCNEKLHVHGFGWHNFGKFCYTQCISSIYPPVPFMAHPLPSDPVGQRGPVFRRKHSAGHVTHTDTQTHHCSGTAGVRRWAGNGVYPLLEAISCPWVKLVYLSSVCRALCVCRSIRVGVCLKTPQNCTITLTWRVSAESVTLYPCSTCH